MNKYESFVGKVLDGRYKILELVGIGGMATVLKAQDLVMKRIVAIKILNDEFTGNESAEARFIDESKAVAMLSNKNIVSVYDVAIYPDIKYIVMEYLDGITFREYLDNKGAIGWKEACVYILQILRGLEHAHSKGIIHRDIKPQNVMLMKNGDIKVTDFGIAKLPSSVSEQKDEKAVGTVYYISPEQACGKVTDYYSDIYSVGVMFYEAVTGTLPFIAETPMEIAMMQVNDDPVHPRDIVLDVPVGVSQIILKAMEKSPEDRFQSAHAMIKAIEWVVRYPDVIFSMNSSDTDESPVSTTSVVSIDMISTAELGYGEEEIKESLEKKKKKKQETEAKKIKERKQKKVVKTKKRKSNITMFPIISGVSLSFIIVAVILLLIVVINAYNNFFSQEDKGEAMFPDIVGSYYNTELQNNLANGAFGVNIAVDEVIYETRDDMENNKIISTEPSANHSSKIGDDDMIHFTSITVNRTAKAIVPNVVGYPKRTAKTMIENLELSFKYETINNPDYVYYNSDQVAEIYPPAGTELDVGGTVTVYFYERSDATNTGRMPNVIGLNEADAKKLAQTLALYTVKFEYEETKDGNNTVIKQSIDPGTISSKGKEVKLTVSIPMKDIIMPDLKGSKPEEVIVKMNKAWKDNKLKYEPMYFVIDENDKFMFEYECSIAESVEDVIISLWDYNYRQVNEYDGSGTVAYQSIKTGDVVPFDTESVSLIYVTYEKFEIPESSEPESSEPESSEPEISEPESSEPEISEPESSEPEISEPESSEPEISEPESSEPESSEPESSEPEISEPEISEPALGEDESSEVIA